MIRFTPASPSKNHKKKKTTETNSDDDDDDVEKKISKKNKKRKLLDERIRRTTYTSTVVICCLSLIWFLNTIDVVESFTIVTNTSWESSVRSSLLTTYQATKNEETGGTTSPKKRRQKNTDTNILFANPQQQQHPAATESKGNKKKNKYSQFSKVEKMEKDPLEALLEDSEQKLQSLKQQLDPRQKRIQEMEQNIPSPPPEATKKIEFPDNKDIDPYDPATFGYIEIGTIIGPHGVHGWTKVQGCTDFPERLTRSGMPLHMKAARKRAPRKVTLASGKFLGDDQFLIQLQGMYDRTAADKLKGATLYYAAQQNTVKLDDDEVFLSDLVGLTVYKKITAEGDEEQEDGRVDSKELVGEVMGVVLAEEMCAVPGLLHDQIEIGIKRPHETPKPGRPQELVLIPLVPEIVPKIDLTEKYMLIDPPAGLLDLTYVREEKVIIKGLLPPGKE
jgi:16S rRNA processing protein RimM